MVEENDFEKKNQERIQALEKAFGPAGKPLSKPGRVLVGEGRLLKMCRRRPKRKIFILFSDILVYGGIIVPGRWYKGQQIIHLEEVVQYDLPDGVGMANQWQLCTPRKSFYMAAESPEEKHAWMEHIEDCKEQTISRLGPMAEKTENFAASWIPDSASAICMRCSERFSVTQRRHHCRRCGYVVCNDCSKERALLENISSKPVRVCKPCMATIQGEPLEGQTQGSTRGGSSRSNCKKDDSVEDKSPSAQDDVSSEEEDGDSAGSQAHTQWASVEDSSWSPYCYFDPAHRAPPPCLNSTA